MTVEIDQATYRICARCVMDTTDPDISFDAESVCNHCREAEALLAQIRLTPAESDRRLQALADRIKARAANRSHDAIVGLSGGVDSSYAAWLAHKLDLRVLAIHFDNGWNSEIAVRNIEAVVEACGFELDTYVVDWLEFRDLQRAFLKAGVVDIEILTDHAITAALVDLAKRHRIPFILSGANIATEFGMPRRWAWNKQDLVNIEAIHKRFGERPLKSFPRMGMWRDILRRRLSVGVEFINILDMANFRKDLAMRVLEQNTGWRYYGGKHYESTFTKFFQAHILPTKFGIDKRRVHLSALIRNGEMSRDDALAELQRPLYDPDALRRDKAFVAKKLGFDIAAFDEILAAPPVPHDRYPTDIRLRNRLKTVAGWMRRLRSSLGGGPLPAAPTTQSKPGR